MSGTVSGDGLGSIRALPAQECSPHHGGPSGIELGDEGVGGRSGKRIDRLDREYVLKRRRGYGKRGIRSGTGDVSIAHSVYSNRRGEVSRLGTWPGTPTREVVSPSEQRQVAQRGPIGVHFGDESANPLRPQRPLSSGQSRTIRVPRDIRVARRVHGDGVSGSRDRA